MSLPVGTGFRDGQAALRPEGRSPWVRGAARPAGTGAGRRGAYATWGKRAFDLGAAVVLVLTLAPALLLLAGLVALDGGRPFVATPTVGRNGRPFRCWAFRVTDPSAADRPGARPGAGVRVAAERACGGSLTPLGAVLRRSGLEELPRLWNLLRGEMSLVGPRPITTAELERRGPAAFRDLGERPGLAGLWQLPMAARPGPGRGPDADPSLAEDLRTLAALLRAALTRPGG